MTRTIRLTTWHTCRLYLVLALLVGLSLPSAVNASSAEPAIQEATAQVLVLSTYSFSSPGVAMATQALHANFRNNFAGRVQFYQEKVDTNRLPETPYADDLISYLKWKYKKEKLDLIIAVGAPALQILAAHRADFLPDTPILFYYFDESDETARRHPPNVMGVWSRPDYGKNLETALALQPGTERAVVVAGSSRQDKFLLAEAEKEMRNYAGRVEIAYLTDLTMEEFQKKLASLPAHSVVILLSILADRDGKIFTGPEVVSLLTSASSAPIYGIARTYLGYGIVGGSVMDFEAAGNRLAELGLRILGGERPQDIPAQAMPNVLMFDGRALRRWGISEGRLPAGSLVEFREPTFWDLYCWYITAGLIVTLLEAVLIAALLMLRARRRRAEASARRLALLAEDQRRKLDDVISNVPGVVWEYSLEPDGTMMKVHFVSSYVERLLGYSVEDWLSTPGFLRSIVHDDDREAFGHLREAIMKGQTDSTFEFRWRAKDGRLLWAEARMTPVLDESGAVIGLRGVTLDITARKQAETQIVYQATLLANVHDAIVATDEQFNVRAWNHAAEELYGWWAEEALGRQVSEVIGIEMTEAQRTEAIRRITEEGHFHTEMIHRHRDGRRLCVQAYTIALRDESGYIIGYVSAHRDVTERKRAEEALRRSNRELQLLNEEKQAANEELLELKEQLTARSNELEEVNRALQEKIQEVSQANSDLLNFMTSANLAVIFLDRQLCIKRYTPQAWRLFNPMPGDVNRPLAHLSLSLDRADLEEDARQVLDDLQIIEREVRSQDGLWYIARLLPYRTEENRIDGVILIFIDITERKRIEERMRHYFELPLIGMVISSPDRGFVEVNQKFGDMLGYSMSELKGKSWLDFTHPDDVAENVRLLEQTFRGETEGFTLDKRYIHRDGHIVYASISARCVRNADRTVDYLVLVIQDITERKRAEEALRQSQQRNLDIIRAMPDLVFLQAPDGTYLDCFTKESSDLLLPPPEFMGKNVRDVLPAEVAEVILACFQRAKETGQPQVYEYPLTIEGELRWFEARIIYTGEDQILSVVRNITERKRAEEALRHSEERLRLAQRTAGVGTWEWNLLTGKSTWSEGMYNLLGLEQGDGNVTVEEFVEFIHPEDRERAVAKAESAVREGEAYFDEFRIIRHDGATLWLMSNGYIVRDTWGKAEWMIGVNVDITERKRIETQLIESEERFRNMADTAPVMIWVSGPDKQCTYFNQRWLNFTGRPLETELGHGWIESVHPDDYERCMDDYNSAFDQRQPFQMEYRLRRADSEYRWVLDTGVPRFSSNHKFLGYIGSCIDVTDSKQAESALQEAFAQVSELKSQLEAENIFLKEEIRLEYNHNEIIGNGEAIRSVLHKIEQVAPTDTTVLILGETGTGKELVARALHSTSLRKDKPLVKVNCAALPATLIESELFGHERGAFTSATTRRLGRFELANGGTIFLDEIGDLPPELQVKLLRVLQEGEFERLGSGKTIKVDVRIIAATNRNLPLEVGKGVFREDLWYRLNVFPLTVPPLRERQEDIPLLVEAFVQQFSKKHGKTIAAIAPAMMRTLTDYSWPGNVRELANVIERAMVNSESPILRLADPLTRPGAVELPSGRQTLEELERQYIIRVLKQTDWRIEGPKGAARILGLNPSTLRTRMAKLKIQKAENGSQ